MMPRHYALLLAATLAAACAGPPPAPGEDNRVGSMGGPAADGGTEQTSPADNTTAATAYIGRWRGVEGMVLDVKARPGGGVSIANQWDLDHQGSFEGSVTSSGLRWSRNGEAITAVISDGDATGLKYLAGKTKCLTVKPGEGYCRD